MADNVIPPALPGFEQLCDDWFQLYLQVSTVDIEETRMGVTGLPVSVDGVLLRRFLEGQQRLYQAYQDTLTLLSNFP